MVDRGIGESPAHGQPGVSGADDDGSGATNWTNTLTALCGRSVHLDGDIRRVRDNVIDGRAFLRLSDERLNILRVGVGVDFAGDLDAVEAVANVSVDAEDALEIHSALERRDDRIQLDFPMLGDCRDAGRQTTGQPDQHVFDRCGAPVLGRENFGVIGVEFEGGLATLFLAQTEKALDGRVSVSPVLPFAGCAPLELRGLGRLGQRLAGVKQRLDVNAVVDLCF